MKLIRSLVGLKTINYYSLMLDVPSWVNYLATTSQGYVIGFASYPELDPKQQTWDIPEWGDQWCELYEIDLQGLDWKDSLLSVPKSKAVMTLDEFHRWCDDTDHITSNDWGFQTIFNNSFFFVLNPKTDKFSFVKYDTVDETYEIILSEWVDHNGWADKFHEETGGVWK